MDTKQAKSGVTYNVNTSSFIPNTLASGAIIEIGSNANGSYVKFADGTMICNATLPNETGYFWFCLFSIGATSNGADKQS